MFLTGSAARFAKPPHPHLAVAQVEVFLQADLDQRPLQGPVRRVAMDVAE
jgi:hypothetical protein